LDLRKDGFSIDKAIILLRFATMGLRLVRVDDANADLLMSWSSWCRCIA
jgi:hypothetical protein